MALRAATAAGFSVGIARLCGLAYPIYGLIAAVIVTDLSPSRTRKLGLQRLVATAVGASSGAGLRQILTPDGWAVGLGILVAMLICHVLRVHDSAKVAGYVSGIVMVAHGTNPWSYAFLRVIETVLGILVAWLISFVPALVRIEEAEAKVDRPDALATAKRG